MKFYELIEYVVLRKLNTVKIKYKLITIKRNNGELTIDCSDRCTADVDEVVKAGINHFEQAVEGLKTA